MRDCSLDNGRCVSLLSILRSPLLRFVDVSGNALTDGVAQAILDFIQSTPSIHFIHLEGNSISTESLSRIETLLVARHMSPIVPAGEFPEASPDTHPGSIDELLIENDELIRGMKDKIFSLREKIEYIRSLQKLHHAFIQFFAPYTFDLAW
jgi:hypothetical protein